MLAYLEEGDLLEAELFLDQLVQAPLSEVTRALSEIPNWAITKLGTLTIMGTESLSSAAVCNELTARGLELEAA
jgi:hypothetical protein